MLGRSRRRGAEAGKSPWRSGAGPEPKRCQARAWHPSDDDSPSGERPDDGTYFPTEAILHRDDAAMSDDASEFSPAYENALMNAVNHVRDE